MLSVLVVRERLQFGNSFPDHPLKDIDLKGRILHNRFKTIDPSPYAESSDNEQP